MTIEVRGVGDTVNRLQWRRAAAKALPPATFHVQGKMKVYPPQMPTVSGYIRTGTLGRNWTMRVDIPALIGTVGNITPYGPYVQGSPGQTAEMARRNWQTTQQVASAEKDTVLGFFKRFIDRQLAGGIK